MMRILRTTFAPVRGMFNFARLRDPPIKDPNTPVMKQKIFSADLLREKYELWPLIFVTALAVSGVIFTLIHSTQKTDVQFRRDGIAPYEKVCPNEIHKLVVINEKKLYRRIKERDCLRRMIGCWRYRDRRRRC